MFGVVVKAQDCGSTANGKVASDYWNTVPNKRLVHRDGKTYLQVFYYMPGGLTKLRTRKWDLMQKLLGCGKGCGLCAGGIIVYDITNGEPQFVGYAVIFPDASGDELPPEAFQNEFGEWELPNWQVIPNGEGLLIVPVE